MAETKIKVNELPQETPTLNDTLLGSNATKEYACKIEDLASLVGGGGILVLTSIQDPLTELVTLDKTWQEIWDALHNGAIYAVTISDVVDGEDLIYSVSYLTEIHVMDGYYLVSFGGTDYVAAGPNDYPYYNPF